ncbi:hypothetical protein [Jonesia quinghaiensis]|uniref:hypothetical protein n=1 Tax=Jonesia quinghaiensis TaxID=262806 RepID=UPI000412D7E8|nr:hypothetical protein [Jonesia quinghaiensis]
MNGVIRYSRAAMSEAERNVLANAQQLERVISDRRRDVAAAMAQYEATGVSAEYAAKEERWVAAADSVLEIVGTLREAMNRTNRDADDACARLRALAQGM